ncbi:MAG: long-chain fatty acid--CoA ligase [Sphingomonadaceae bacterium]
MIGGMQDWELRVSMLLDHAARDHGDREILTRWNDGSETRTNWRGIRHDALRMVQALRRMGLQPGDRVATLAMNHNNHLVSWFGATGAGGVLHTINPRLFEEQLDYIANHAEDRFMLYDAVFQPIVDKMKERWTTIEHYICFDSGEHAVSFDDWIGAEDGNAEWTMGSERDPCMLCYTSGTTGNPKGVLFEHRSNMLHTWAVMTRQALGVDAQSTILPVVPMFHANNWGFPWAAAAVGSKLVYCANNEPANLIDLIEKEKINYVAGVPTVWLALTQYCDAKGIELPSQITHALTGGSAMPRAMIERLMKAGIRIGHAWGMTETSPVASVAFESSNWDELSFDEQVSVKALQGRALFGCEVRTVDLDDPKKPLPRDGETSGALQVRGPWVLKRYFKGEEDCVDEDQWFDTGDVAIMHEDGTIQLTDRTKDVIKSGGEWISSVELENAAIAHPGVAEAAAIGIAHPKWDERPILVVVKKPDEDVDPDALRATLAAKVAKWWLPDAVEFVDEIPHTASGKISKKDLRDQFADYKLEA